MKTKLPAVYLKNGDKLKTIGIDGQSIIVSVPDPVLRSLWASRNVALSWRGLSEEEKSARGSHAITERWSKAGVDMDLKARLASIEQMRSEGKTIAEMATALGLGTATIARGLMMIDPTLRKRKRKTP